MHDRARESEEKQRFLAFNTFYEKSVKPFDLETAA